MKRVAVGNVGVVFIEMSVLPSSEHVDIYVFVVVEEGLWENGLSYECRTLLFKAIHNLLER